FTPGVQPEGCRAQFGRKVASNQRLGPHLVVGKECPVDRLLGTVLAEKAPAEPRVIQRWRSGKHPALGSSQGSGRCGVTVDVPLLTGLSVSEVQQEHKVIVVMVRRDEMRC